MTCTQYGTAYVQEPGTEPTLTNMSVEFSATPQVLGSLCRPTTWLIYRSSLLQFSMLLWIYHIRFSSVTLIMIDCGTSFFTSTGGLCL